MANRTVLTISELADRTGIFDLTLRKWWEQGLLQAGGKSSTGDPFFSEDMAERAYQIQKLLEMGYGEEEVRKILRKVGLPNDNTSGNSGEQENLLTVGALAESVGVSPRTIKHWEDKGIIDADARSEGGFRLYKEHYTYLCHLIQDLQLFGYSLDEIKEISDYFRDFMLMREDLEQYPPENATETIDAMLSEIDKLFQTTGKLRDGIERWEKLLNRHKKLIVDLKRANDKRRDSRNKSRNGDE